MKKKDFQKCKFNCQENQVECQKRDLQKQIEQAAFQDQFDVKQNSEALPSILQQSQNNNINRLHIQMIEQFKYQNCMFLSAQEQKFVLSYLQQQRDVIQYQNYMQRFQIISDMSRLYLSVQKKFKEFQNQMNNQFKFNIKEQYQQYLIQNKNLKSKLQIINGCGVDFFIYQNMSKIILFKILFSFLIKLQIICEQIINYDVDDCDNEKHNQLPYLTVLENSKPQILSQLVGKQYLENILFLFSLQTKQDVQLNDSYKQLAYQFLLDINIEELFEWQTADKKNIVDLMQQEQTQIFLNNFVCCNNKIRNIYHKYQNQYNEISQQQCYDYLLKIEKIICKNSQQQENQSAVFLKIPLSSQLTQIKDINLIKSINQQNIQSTINKYNEQYQQLPKYINKQSPSNYETKLKYKEYIQSEYMLLDKEKDDASKLKFKLYNKISNNQLTKSIIISDKHETQQQKVLQEQPPTKSPNNVIDHTITYQEYLIQQQNKQLLKQAQQKCWDKTRFGLDKCEIDLEIKKQLNYLKNQKQNEEMDYQYQLQNRITIKQKESLINENQSEESKYLKNWLKSSCLNKQKQSNELDIKQQVNNQHQDEQIFITQQNNNFQQYAQVDQMQQQEQNEQTIENQGIQQEQIYDTILSNINQEEEKLTNTNNTTDQIIESYINEQTKMDDINIIQQSEENQEFDEID